MKTLFLFYLVEVVGAARMPGVRPLHVLLGILLLGGTPLHHLLLVHGLLAHVVTITHVIHERPTPLIHAILVVETLHSHLLRNGKWGQRSGNQYICPTTLYLKHFKSRVYFLDNFIAILYRY